MAQVCRGTDTVLGRVAAIKVLAPQYAKDQAFVERFRREAQAAARLNHPGVVSVYDTGSDGGIHYIVMEYVDGRTLAEVLDQEGRLQPERAAEVLAQVAEALSFAHRSGIVHRDVKPANIMIGRGGEVKVMDFGIARAVASQATLTATATVLGTASYLSPEQAQGEAVDHRSDIYSLGAVARAAPRGPAAGRADHPAPRLLTRPLSPAPSDARTGGHDAGHDTADEPPDLTAVDHHAPSHQPERHKRGHPLHGALGAGPGHGNGELSCRRRPRPRA